MSYALTRRSVRRVRLHIDANQQAQIEQSDNEIVNHERLVAICSAAREKAQFNRRT